MEHLSWHKNCQAVIESVRQALEAHGWRVLRTFDLQSARSILPRIACNCPHHDTPQCTCQYAILLVYGTTPTPVLIVVHGRDGWTSLSMPQLHEEGAALRLQVEAVVLNALHASK
ncbi:MAG: hypothetical protein ACPGWR_05355 [Ardenticatenaceae bacterium]